MLRGDFAAADSAFRQAIASDPKHAPAYRGRGLVLERMGQTEQAASAFRRFLRLSPSGSAADKIRARLETLEAK
jgi:regulator of sirC expression with transglutaminase-like and TPR domain